MLELVDRRARTRNQLVHFKKICYAERFPEKKLMSISEASIRKNSRVRGQV